MAQQSKKTVFIGLMVLQRHYHQNFSYHQLRLQLLRQLVSTLVARSFVQEVEDHQLTTMP